MGVLSRVSLLGGTPRKLVEDGLSGECGLRPLGTQIAEGVWHGAGAQVDSSAMINGPAFIGAQS